jgi:hypothetical protein
MKPKILTFKNLEEMMEYNENHPQIIHLQTFTSLKKQWSTKKTTSNIDIFKISFEDDEEYKDMLLTVYKNGWEKALSIALDYFIEQEEYETCAQIRNLLTSIKNKNQ